jgi:hypothetical protein
VIKLSIPAELKHIPLDELAELLRKIKWRRRTMIEQRANFDEKYPESALGAFLVTGNQYFDRQILIARQAELLTFKPFKTFKNGAAQIFKPRVPGRRYVIGADVARGVQVTSKDTDYHAAVCLDLETGEEYAAYRVKGIEPSDYAYDLSDLGAYYNNAVIAVERTGDGGTVILTLKGECKYGAIYLHKDWHKREKKMVEFEGFPTTPKTRPIALNFVSSHINDYPHLIWDKGFCDEALTFVRDEKGIPAGAPGAHDDRVSARWVAHGARRALLGWWIPYQSKSERYENSDAIGAEELAEV